MGKAYKRRFCGVGGKTTNCRGSGGKNGIWKNPDRPHRPEKPDFVCGLVQLRSISGRAPVGGRSFSFSVSPPHAPRAADFPFTDVAERVLFNGGGADVIFVIMKNIVVLISGRGSNFVAIAQACERENWAAEGLSLIHI